MPSNLKSLLTEARTCRRFQADYNVPYNDLEELVDMARISPSACNGQVLRYVIVQDKHVCQEMFSSCVFGGAFKSAQRPTEHQAPTAYIVILAPHDLNEWSIMDIGIAAQTIQIAATEKGLGACMVGSFNGKKILETLQDKGLDICDKASSVFKNNDSEDIMLKVRLVVAIGKPSEERVITNIAKDESTVYFRENDIHNVPKRVLDDVLLLKI